MTMPRVPRRPHGRIAGPFLALATACLLLAALPAVGRGEPAAAISPGTVTTAEAMGTAETKGAAEARGTTGIAGTAAAAGTPGNPTIASSPPTTGNAAVTAGVVAIATAQAATTSSGQAERRSGPVGHVGPTATFPRAAPDDRTAPSSPAGQGGPTSQTGRTGQIGPAAKATAPKAAGGKAPGLFNRARLNVLIIIIALLALLAYFTYSARSGKDLFIRRISGLAAIDDAVGRATEMGRQVLFVPGIRDMDDIQTIAGITLLGHVARKTAEYDVPLLAPMTRPFTMTVAQEVVKQAYIEKGRPEAFRPDRINYLTQEQFGYVSGVTGITLREQPAACFYLGNFAAESLLLAETGAAVGAIQIAGTAVATQVPFFVVACDYTLIGEELFAASAYLSRSPQEVGSLKGQDYGKLLLMIAILLGTILVTLAAGTPGERFPILKTWSEGLLALFTAT